MLYFTQSFLDFIVKYHESIKKKKINHILKWICNAVLKWSHPKPVVYSDYNPKDSLTNFLFLHLYECLGNIQLQPVHRHIHNRIGQTVLQWIFWCAVSLHICPSVFFYYRVGLIQSIHTLCNNKPPQVSMNTARERSVEYKKLFWNVDDSYTYQTTQLRTPIQYCRVHSPHIQNAH